jgi:hypothetical protein
MRRTLYYTKCDGCSLDVQALLFSSVGAVDMALHDLRSCIEMWRAMQHATEAEGRIRAARLRRCTCGGSCSVNAGLEPTYIPLYRLAAWLQFISYSLIALVHHGFPSLSDLFPGRPGHLYQCRLLRHRPANGGSSQRRRRHSSCQVGSHLDVCSISRLSGMPANMGFWRAAEPTQWRYVCGRPSNPRCRHLSVSKRELRMSNSKHAKRQQNSSFSHLLHIQPM